MRGRIDGGLRGRPAGDPDEVTLVAVTQDLARGRRPPARRARRAATSPRTATRRPRSKAAACADLRCVWHFVGQLQTNKARSVARYADVVHAVDRARLVDGPRPRRPRTRVARLRVLVQVSLDAGTWASDRGRGGAHPEDVADRCARRSPATAALDLVGVMGVAPLGGDPDAAFARLADVARAVRGGAPGRDVGVGRDERRLRPSAIRHGATHVRVGSALLGNRPPLR